MTIYLDNASTSFPKPSNVVKAITSYLSTYGVSPGRGSHCLAEKCDHLVDETRSRLNTIIHGEKKEHLIFTYNATHSLNLVINGFLKQGDHVLICSYSHNSVIRPIEKLKRNKMITYDVFEIDINGQTDLFQFRNKIKKSTRLVILNHASNVIGVIANFLPVANICQLLGINFMLDCTQSLGYAPIDLTHMPIDFLCGTGHKTLLGPSGIGFVYIKRPQDVDHLIVGGSAGNYSSSPFHPIKMPHKFEAGTLNTTAIAGLYGSLEYIEKYSQNKIKAKAMILSQYAWKKLSELEELELYGTSDFENKVPIISYNIRNLLTNEAGFLYNHRGICLRVGLHCAPFIHKTLKTVPTGTSRISFSHFNNLNEIDRFIDQTKQIIMECKHGKTCA